MTNDEARMTKECPNDECPKPGVAERHFVIRASSFLRHSRFVIRH